jgi:transposase InsO family protein
VNRFFDEHRARCGVEPICRALQVAPSAYRRHAARRRDPARLPERAQRDSKLLPQVQRVYDQNLQVYGADKVWRQLRREGAAVARCTVERLMRLRGLQGARRGKKVRTTVPDAKAACPLDRVKRQFKADRPNQLWVADFTLRLDLARLRLCGLCHRCLRSVHRGLARQQLDADRLRARRTGAGFVRAPTRARRCSGASLR